LFCCWESDGKTENNIGENYTKMNGIDRT